MCGTNFFSRPNGTDFTCKPCDNEKVDCSQPGAKRNALAVKPGYWRATIDTEMEWIQECFNSEACSGADNTEDGSERRRRLMMSGGASGLLSVFSSSGRLLEAEDDDPAANATYGEALCAEGHTGLLCSVCVRTPVAYQGGGDNMLCTRCKGGSLALAFVPFILFVIFLILILIMFCRIGSGKDDGTSSGFVQASAENITASASDGKDLGKIAAPALEDMGNTAMDAGKAAAKGKINAQAGAAVDTAEGKAAEGKDLSLKDKGVPFLRLVQEKISHFMPKIKITISLWQVLKGIGFSFSIPYPPLYQNTIDFVAAIIEIDLPQILPLGCVMPLTFFDKLVVRTIVPLVVYAALLLVARAYYSSTFYSPVKGGLLVDTVFFIIFLVYPSTATSLFSAFVCVPFEDGSTYLRRDLSIQCTLADGSMTGEYFFMLVYVLLMIAVHTAGSLLLYAYLFFVSYRKPLLALKAQEQVKQAQKKLDQNVHLSNDELTLAVKLMGTAGKTISTGKPMPGFMKQLTGPYERRCYWFEIFESLRKVLLVGIPACFSNPGGNAQLVWGLLVCFVSFGMYMQFEPYAERSDDHLAQIAQMQIFLTLVASIGLRMTPPDEDLAKIVSGLLFAIPVIALTQETPVFDLVRGACNKMVAVILRVAGRLKGAGQTEDGQACRV